jgi:hypothetical protein
MAVCLLGLASPLVPLNGLSGYPPHRRDGRPPRRTSARRGTSPREFPFRPTFPGRLSLHAGRVRGQGLSTIAGASGRHRRVGSAGLRERTTVAVEERPRARAFQRSGQLMGPVRRLDAQARRVLGDKAHAAVCTATGLRLAWTVETAKDAASANFASSSRESTPAPRAAASERSTGAVPWRRAFDQVRPTARNVPRPAGVSLVVSLAS